MAHFAYVVRRLRRERGWSQATLGHAARVAESTVFAAEHGRPVTLATAAKLCGALQVSLHEALAAGAGHAHCRHGGATHSWECRHRPSPPWHHVTQAGSGYGGNGGSSAPAYP